MVADDPNLRFTSAMTVEAWIYPTSFAGASHEIVSKWDAASGADRSYTFKCDSSGKLYLSLSSSGTSATEIPTISTNAVALSQWSHVAGTYDGTTVRVYINGSLQGTTLFTNGIFAGHADLGIGAALIAGSYFSGKIDEASVYNRALSQSELQGIFSAGASGKCASISTNCIPAPAG